MCYKYVLADSGEVISEKYVLEYGTDCLEMHIKAAEQGDRALVVDDLIATGGTLLAAINLLERRYGGKQLYASEDDGSVNHALVRDLDADAVRLEQFGAELEADE